MSRSAIGLAVLSFAALPAMADDLSAPARFDWSGFYIGAHAGYGRGETRVENAFNPAMAYSPEPEGGLFGLQAGYNHQFGPVVLGIEADGSLTALDARMKEPFLALLGESEVDYLASVRLRAGVAVDNILLFATGGAAFGEWSDRSFFGDGTPFGPRIAHERTGWVAGGGVEYAFSTGWSARVEYLHYDLGSKVDGAGETFWSIEAERFEGRFDVIRAGVNYRF